ncbi:MAG: hypothetical protein NTW86_32535, partial [Candidatus Sumerlaeota bacterium]|nr:hypothetical protein [Candidatus Sumerlaeota bacterium]
MSGKLWGKWLILVVTLSMLGGTAVAQESKEEPFDMGKAQQLYNKQKAGGQLTPEERAYVQKAVELRRQRQGGAQSRPAGAKAGGGKNAAAGKKPNAEGTSVGFIPLSDMTTETYKGQDGGLYGHGKNEPPKEQMDAAMKAAKEIRPLDADGKPSPNGKIVLLSLGMSNTTMEFKVFKEIADADPDKAPNVVLVDGAQGGQDSEVWARGTVRGGQPAAKEVWQIAEDRINAEGVTTKQIQAVWLKQARIGPANIGEFPKHAQELQKDIEMMLQMAKQRY